MSSVAAPAPAPASAPASAPPPPSAGRTSSPERTERAHALLREAIACSDPERARRLRNEVVELHRDVAASIASRYYRRGIAADDLEQTAMEGLCKAVNRFEPDMDFDFMSYAVPTIRGEVLRYFRDHGWAIRPPRRLQEMQWRMQRATDELSQSLGRQPQRAEVARELDTSLDELDEAMQAFGAFTPSSLDQPVGPDSIDTLGSFIADDVDDFAASEAQLVVAALMKTLKPRDQRILNMRFCEERTQAEIGRALGVTQMQVSRILQRIYGQLRTALEETPPARSRRPEAARASAA